MMPEQVVYRALLRSCQDLYATLQHHLSENWPYYVSGLVASAFLAESYTIASKIKLKEKALHAEREALRITHLDALLRYLHLH